MNTITPPPSAPNTPPAWRFDHVNVGMGDSAALRTLFEGVMGLRPGYRPPFPFPGLWLYAGDQALVHAVNDAALPAGSANVSFGHVAFRSDEAAGTVIARLQQSRLPFRVAQVPQDNTTQIFVQLPGGFVVELDVPDEATAASPTPGPTDAK